MTLTKFLLARIAEDEESARNPQWLALEYGLDSAGRRAFSERVLTECAAKRQIVENHERNRTDLMRECDVYSWESRVLASVYADHPNYRQVWKP